MSVIYACKSLAVQQAWKKNHDCWWTSNLPLHIQRDNNNSLGKNLRENCRKAHLLQHQSSWGNCPAPCFTLSLHQRDNSSIIFPETSIWEWVALSPACHHYESGLRICLTVRQHDRTAQKLQTNSMSYRDCYRFQRMEVVFVKVTVQRTSKLFN